MATVTTASSHNGHALRNWVLAGLGATVVLGLIIFGIIYGAEKNSSGSTGAGNAKLGVVAVQVESHATDVRDHADQMIQSGQAQSNNQWVEQGTNLLAEARRLELVADQIRATDNDYRTMFRPGQGADIYRLRADGLALEETGQMLVDHGQSFAATADEMIAQAQALGSAALVDSARLMKASAADMISDGRGVISAAQPLLNEADELERSLGH